MQKDFYNLVVKHVTNDAHSRSSREVKESCYALVLILMNGPDTIFKC